MHKRLISKLLEVAQSTQNEFPKSAALAAFCSQYQLGLARGRSRIMLTNRDKDEIRAILRATEGIDAQETSASDWDDASRSGALALGFNEKLATGAVKRNRVSLKALAGQALHLNGVAVQLFPRAHLDVDWASLADIAHDGAIVVENYECFDVLDQMKIDLGCNPAAPRSPVAIYRGDRHESRQDNVRAFLAKTGLPVIFFGDFDPASLVEASNIPGAIGMLVPESLEELLHERGRADLYRNQVGPAFDRLAEDPRPLVRDMHRILCSARKGLVHEWVITNDLQLTLRLFGDLLPGGT